MAGITERFAIREQPMIPNFNGSNLFTNMKLFHEHVVQRSFQFSLIVLSGMMLPK